MICERCGTDTVTWRGPFSNLTHTECSNCGGINCQIVHDERIESDDYEEEDEDQP